MMDREVIEKIAKELADQGKIIEAGWLAMQKLVIPPTAKKEQVEDMRIAFMGGAIHMMSSLFSILDNDEMETEDELRRMEAIKKEMFDFESELAKIVASRVSSLGKMMDDLTAPM